MPYTPMPGEAGHRPPTPVQSDRKFRPHFWAMIPVVLVFVAVFATNIALALQGVKPAEDLVGHIGGGAIAILLFAVLPAWLTWRFSRSRLASSIVLTAISGLFLMGMLTAFLGAFVTVTSRSTPAMQQAAAEFEQKMDSMNSQLAELRKRSARGEDVTAEQTRLMEEFASATEEAGDSGENSDAKAVRALSVWARRLQVTQAELVQAQTNLNEVGGFDWTTLKSIADIDERIVLMHACAVTCVDMSDFALQSEHLIDSELQMQGVPAAMAKQIVEYWRIGFPVHLLVDRMKCERAIADTSVQMLELLKSQWGKWQCDAEGHIIFDDANVAQQYDELREKLDASFMASAAAQERMFQHADKTAQRRKAR